MICKIEVVEVKFSPVVCNGGNTFGHPRVYLQIGKKGKIVCPYCSCCYAFKNSAKQKAAY